MKSIIEKVTLAAGAVNPQHIQLVMAVIILSLLIIGAGAPATGGETLPGTGP